MKGNVDMGVMDKFLDALHLNNEDEEYDEYDYYDERRNRRQHC